MMVGMSSLSIDYGPPAALFLSLGFCLFALKAQLIDARTHLEDMLILAGAFVAILTASYSLDLGKILAVGWMMLLILLIGRRYREMLAKL